MFHKLSTKLTFLFLLMALIPIFLISIYLNSKVKSSLKQTIMTDYKYLAIEKANAIDHAIEERIYEIKQISLFPKIYELLKKANSNYSNVSSEP